jgi:hypothetical protein
MTSGRPSTHSQACGDRSRTRGHHPITSRAAEDGADRRRELVATASGWPADSGMRPAKCLPHRSRRLAVGRQAMGEPDAHDPYVHNALTRP